jgi:hypothetical protein
VENTRLNTLINLIQRIAQNTKLSDSLIFGLGFGAKNKKEIIDLIQYLILVAEFYKEPQNKNFHKLLY